MISANDLYTSPLPKLAEIINKLKELSKALLQLSDKINDLKKQLKILKAKLGGMDSEQKLNDLLKQILNQKERLSFIESDIDKLIELAKKLDGYTSDDEEAYFVENLISELEGLKPKVVHAKEEVDSIEREILATKKLIDDKKASKQDFTDDELNDIVAKIAELDSRVERSDFNIGEIEKVVDGKKQRFAEMDLFSKFTRRSKELQKLRGILDERSKIVEDLVKDCTDDLNDEKSQDDLKEVCKEVIGECDEHSKKIAEIA